MQFTRADLAALVRIEEQTKQIPAIAKQIDACERRLRMAENRLTIVETQLKFSFPQMSHQDFNKGNNGNNGNGTSLLRKAIKVVTGC